MLTILLSLLTGVITGCIALAGVVYTQGRAAQRLREERAWQHELWAREQRCEAHLAFLAEQRRLDQLATMHARVGLKSGKEPGPDWTHTLSRHLIKVQVFGSSEAAAAAQQLFQVIQDIPTGAVGEMVRVDDLVETYRRAVQHDLGLKETELPA